MPCDQWRLSGADLTQVRVAWDADPSRTAVASWRDSFGPPTIFPETAFDALRSLHGDAGAKSIIDSRDTVRFVPMENAQYDLDEPEDLEAMFEAGRPPGIASDACPPGKQ